MFWGWKNKRMEKKKYIVSFENKMCGHTAHTFSRLLFDILIWEKFISISSRFQMTDKYFLGGLSCRFNNIATKAIDHVCKIPCFSFRFLFLMWTALNFEGRLKTNKRYGHTAHTFSRLLLDILIWGRFISISSRFQMTDKYFLGDLSCWFNNIATKTIDHVCKIPCLSFRFLFLVWTTLNFGDRSKTKKWATDICRGTLGIECKRDRPVGLGATLGDGLKIKNNADSVILLGIECTIYPQNLIKIVWAIFEKFEILNFFLMWTILNFNGKSEMKKEKSGMEIFARDSIDIEFERDRSIGLGSTIGDGQTDRQTDTHTDIFSKTNF